MKAIEISGTTRLVIFFIILCIAGAFLLQIPLVYKAGKVAPFIDALFTSVSAVCVTGLSTLDMNVYTNFGFLIIMLLIEFGGLGIITFLSVLISIPSKKISLVNRRVVRQFSIVDVESNPRKIVSDIIRYTLGIQFVGFLLLVPLLKSHGIENYLFDSLFLAISAFCNAGFAPYSDSLIRFDNAMLINLVIISLIIFGGIGFIVLSNIHQVRIGIKKRLSAHTKIVFLATGSLILIGFVFFYLAESNNAFSHYPWYKKMSAALFQSVTPRTCGFETIPQRDFSNSSNLLTMLLMFIGGSPASIAGGIKTTTFFVVLWYVFRGDDKTGTVPFFNRTISAETVNKATMVMIKSFIVIFIAVFFLCYTEKTRLLAHEIEVFDVVFEAVSAFGTVGLSQGITGELSFSGKIVLIVTMFVGRTALATMMLVLPSIIKKQKYLRYPEEEVIIG